MLRTFVAALALLTATTTPLFARVCDDESRLLVVTKPKAEELSTLEKINVNGSGTDEMRRRQLNEFAEIFPRHKLHIFKAPPMQVLHDMMITNVQLFPCSSLANMDLATFWERASPYAHVYIKEGRKLVPFSRRGWKPFKSNNFLGASYKSPGLNANEGATITYYVIDQNSKVLHFQLAAVFEASAPITKFEGVSLRKEKAAATANFRSIMQRHPKGPAPATARTALPALENAYAATHALRHLTT